MDGKASFAEGKRRVTERLGEAVFEAVGLIVRRYLELPEEDFDGGTSETARETEDGASAARERELNDGFDMGRYLRLRDGGDGTRYGQARDEEAGEPSVRTEARGSLRRAGDAAERYEELSARRDAAEEISASAEAEEPTRVFGRFDEPALPVELTRASGRLERTALPAENAEDTGASYRVEETENVERTRRATVRDMPDGEAGLFRAAESGSETAPQTRTETVSLLRARTEAAEGTAHAARYGADGDAGPGAPYADASHKRSFGGAERMGESLPLRAASGLSGEIERDARRYDGEFYLF